MSRKTHYAWMALGALVGLLGVAVICKLGESARAETRTRPTPRAVVAALAVGDVPVNPKPPEPSVPAPPPIAPAKPPVSLPEPPPVPGNLPAPSDKQLGGALPPLPPPGPPAVSAKAESSDPLLGPAPTVAPPSGKEAPKPEPLPPPLPAVPSVPPPSDQELKPVPPTPTGEPLPPLSTSTLEAKAPMPNLPTVVTPPDAKPTSATPPPLGSALPTVGPASALPTPPPPSAPPVPAGKPEVMPVSFSPAPTPAPPAPVAVDRPPGTPLPPVGAVKPAPMAKATPSDEPPLAPAPGPVVIYQVRAGGETMRDIARHTLGDEERWADVHRLNPSLQPESVLAAGTTVKLPSDACVHDDDSVQPLPAMHPKAVPQKPKAVLPLTGTFAANLDEKRTLLLPRAIRDQLGNSETLLVSPGSDQCLWLTNQTHLDRLADRLEHSPAREADVRIFKRLYFAQTEKAAVSDDGRVTVPDRLVQFAGLRQEVVLVGIDDHFELWDAAKWRTYTQQKSAAARAAMAERE